MKITRELIDNGQMIIHANYTRAEKEAIRKQFSKKCIEKADQAAVEEVEAEVVNPESTEEKTEDKEV